MTDMVSKFKLGTKTLEQGAKARGFNNGEQALDIAKIFQNFGLTFGGTEI